MRLFFYIFSITVVGLCMSCSRSGGSNGGSDGPHLVNWDDNTTPVVEVYSPVANHIYLSGDTIQIRGRVTDNGLYRGFVRITNDANGAIVKEQSYEIHGFTAYVFSIDHKTAVTVPSDYTVTVQFEDHGLNAGTKTVQVKVDP